MQNFSVDLLHNIAWQVLTAWSYLCLRTADLFEPVTSQVEAEDMFPRHCCKIMWQRVRVIWLCRTEGGLHPARAKKWDGTRNHVTRCTWQMFGFVTEAALMPWTLGRPSSKRSWGFSMLSLPDDDDAPSPPRAPQEHQDQHCLSSFKSFKCSLVHSF